MIPKQVFYMWCGPAKPVDVEMCVLSWRQNLPGYKIIEINEQSTEYFDFAKARQENAFFDFVCRNKIWAVAADFVRFSVLEKFGGIWLDTDVTVTRDFDDMLNNGMFFGRDDENKEHVEAAVIGSAPHNAAVQDMLKFYDDEIWHSELYTGPRVATEILKRHGFNPQNKGIVKFEDISVYPPEYFFPFALDTKFEPTCLTNETRTIHWWKASWSKLSMTNWLKNKHIIGKEKAVRINLNDAMGIYLFSFLRVATYYPSEGKITLCGLPFIKIKKQKNKCKAMLFGCIPLLKWK